MKYKVLKIVSLFNSLIFFAPLALLVRTSRGISVQQFFILQMILSFFIFVFEIPGGFITDKIGYKRSLVISHCTTFVARVLLWRASSFSMFAVEAMIEAFAGSMASGTFEAYMYTDEPEMYTKNISLLGNWGTVGFIASTLLYFPLIKLGTLQTLLTGTVITSFVAAAGSFFIPSEKKKVIDNGQKKRKKKLDLKGVPIKKIIIFPVMDSCISISFLVVNFFYIIKLQECRVNQEWMTGIIIGYSAIQMLAPIVLNKMSKIRSNAVKIIPTVIVIDLLFMALCLTNNLAVLIPMLLLPSFLCIISFLTSELQNNFIDTIEGDEHRATILSVFSMGTNLFDIAFLGISGFLSKQGTSIPFLVAGNVTLLIGFIFAAYSRNWKADTSFDKG